MIQSKSELVDLRFEISGEGLRRFGAAKMLLQIPGGFIDVASHQIEGALRIFSLDGVENQRVVFVSEHLAGGGDGRPATLTTEISQRFQQQFKNTVAGGPGNGAVKFEIG